MRLPLRAYTRAAGASVGSEFVTMAPPTFLRFDDAITQKSRFPNGDLFEIEALVRVREH